MKPIYRKAAWVVLPLLVATLTLAGYRIFRSDAHAGHTSVVQPASATDSTAATASGLAAYDKNGDGIVYRSGMHPWIVQDEPGQCPICGMDLVATPVTASEEGLVQIDPVTMQNIGVRTAIVEVASLAQTVRTTGRFEANQQGLSAVSPKIGGWVEQLFVDYEGARVRKGQPLLTIYSPELVSTQEEYLLALRHAERLGGTPDAERLVEAARRRLAYWDITDTQIARLKETGEPEKTVTLYAPSSGTVTMKDVVEGQQIMPGMTLLELSDLSRLWLMVDVYEQDLGWVKVGTAAQIEMPYSPGQSVTGKIDYLYDVLDPETRTLKARVTLPNPGLQLKPGMYATVTLTGGQTEALPVAPEEALIRTGDRAVVVVALGAGRFRPVVVLPGIQTQGRTQILSGLTGGEEIVTSAQFLIDSEAKLKSAVGAMLGGHNHGAPAGEPTGTPAPAAAPPGAQPGAADHSKMDHSSQAAPARARLVGGTQVIDVTVSPAGYAPKAITLKAGVPARLVFTRTADGGCTDQVQIPAFGIKATALPVGQPVAFDVTPREDGTFTFACGMDMVKGTIVVRS
jgi:Cu(I)/Ag(I) efflux system membrane fusion protein